MTNPVGCRGVRVPGATRCLAHLSARKRHRYLARLGPGADLDHRGTTFTSALLESVLLRLRDPDSHVPRIGRASFSEATFDGDARFDRTMFGGDVSFQGATFNADASFYKVTFSDIAWFDGVRVRGYAGFNRATFSTTVSLGSATFNRDVDFSFATFKGTIPSYGIAVTGWAWFLGATFAVQSDLGPLRAKRVVLSNAIFMAPVTIELLASKVSCIRTQWMSTATVRLRHADVDLTDAVLSWPVAIAAHPTSFTYPSGKPVDEGPLAGANTGVRVTSVRGADAAHLVLTNIDLSTCRFSGAFHLDQLRLEGRCTFALVPAGPRLWRYQLRSRWTRRRTLAEEHRWRAALAIGNPGPPRGWNPGSPFDHVLSPADVAATYRELRKALEDSKNEPGAADFYYGEMEMRRHDRVGTPRAERALLWAYWLLSGYGLRALRAVSWLVATMVLTVVLLMMFGLPAAPGPTQHSTLTVKPIGLSTAPVDPSGVAPKNWLTLPRLDRATRTAMDSAVFRSPGEGLTTIGTYVEMASRFAEPILLILALMAVRNRVKR
ncbi:pentapeptide repeat-containing protein [Streptomyces sp. NBC_00386]|uniref:pentapeptide repeat-containing protein n=1 Tax=Streptomyces sp. NBC_00386 TaxID=2975734 RepID=UPI002E24AD54